MTELEGIILKLKVKGKRVRRLELTIDEAQELHSELDTLFGNDKNYWYYPYPYTYPTWEQPATITYTDMGTKGRAQIIDITNPNQQW